MLKSFMLTAWRNITRNKVFSVINISGLALGMACSLLIMLWVQDERSVDAFHENGSRLYQVYERQYYDGKVEANYPTQGLLAEELKKNIPEIELSSGFEYTAPPGTQSTMAANEKVNKMTGMFAGEDFFKMFTYPLLQGNAATALKEPSSVAISKKMAEHYFKNTGDAIGKTIRYENKEDLLVTAVFENVPVHSSQRFDFLRSWKDFITQNEWVNNWGNTSPSTFVMLRQTADPLMVESKIKDFIYRYQQKDKSFRMELALQPYTGRYLHSTFKNGYIDGGRIQYVRLFSIVAIFILLIACINFMNLATARSGKRSKEVGIRKVVGAPRSSLIFQFMGEAWMLTFIAFLIAIAIAGLLLPAFNSITGKQMELPIGKPIYWLALFTLLVVTGFVAGSYPALFLSSLKPVTVLKGKLNVSASSLFLRKGLVIFQFSLSIILIVGMIVVYRQVNYIQTKNIGYNRENLVYIPIEGELVKNYPVFKEAAGKLNSIMAISKMRNSPTEITHHTNSIGWPGKSPDLNVSFADGVVGYDFVKTLKLQLKEGRDFSRAFGTDSASYLLNETAANKIGFKNAVGQTINWGSHQGKVIGVLKDFHFSSLHQNFEPLVLRLDENWNWGTILVRVKAGQTKAALTDLEALYKKLNPAFPFSYQFSDEEYARLYRGEEIVSRLAFYFSFLAIFISCLGLFGLATFTAEQRTKEIGVRKVLGASVTAILSLLSSNFLRPVIIAMLVAFPVSWYAANNWLDDFAFKQEMSWWILPLAGIVTIVISVITVGFISIKSAMANPVKSLRSE